MKTYIRHVCLLIFLILVNYTLISQVNFPLDLKTADSLEQLLPNAVGKERVDILNGISFSLIRHYSDKSDSTASLAIELADELDYKAGLAKAFFSKGTSNYIKGDFIDAIELLYDALGLYEESADTNMIIETYYQIGAISFFSLTDLEEGLRCIQKCIDYAKASGLTHWVSQMYSSYQYCYSMAGDNENALKYLDMYIQYAEDRSVERLEMAMVIAAYGRTYSKMGEHRKALEKYLETWPVIRKDDVEERAYLSQLTYSIGSEYSALGVTDSAFYFYKHGMMLARKNLHYWGSMMNAIGLGRQYLMEKDIKKSELYCDSAIYFGHQIDSLSSFYGIKEYSRMLGMSGELYIPLNLPFKRYLAWQAMSGAYQMLERISEVKNDFKKALIVNKSLNAINDSIYHFQKRTEILDLQYKYQVSQKDNEIVKLSQENQIQRFRNDRNQLIILSVISISVLLLLILVLFMQQNRIKTSRKVTEFKQRLLRSQMNPHFIFNSLTSIQNFIMQQDDIKASVYLSRFSDLVRNILTNSQVELITLEEEINTIENYLELQKIRFPEKFGYSIELDDKLNPESTNLPPMLTQSFIENAIEHGFKHIDATGFIDLDFGLKQDLLTISITDNGIGRSRSQELKSQQDKDHKSMATMITSERIRTINKKLKKKILFEIIDLKDENVNATGTKVVFEIPLSL